MLLVFDRHTLIILIGKYKSTNVFNYKQGKIVLPKYYCPNLSNFTLNVHEELKCRNKLSSMYFKQTIFRKKKNLSVIRTVGKVYYHVKIRVWFVVFGYQLRR